MTEGQSEAVVVIEEEEGRETVWVEVDGRILRGRVVRISEPAASWIGTPGVDLQTFSGLRLRKDLSGARLATSWPFRLTPGDLVVRAAEIEPTAAGEAA